MRRMAIPVLIISMLLGAGPLAVHRASAAGPKVRTFDFTYDAKISSAPPGTKQLRIWVPYPVTDGNQEIYDMRISAPGTYSIYREPVYRDSILFVQVDNPEGPVNLQLDFKVRRSEYLRRDFPAHPVAYRIIDPDLQKYLGADRLVPLSGRIRKLAAEVTRRKRTDIEKARAIYDYTIANMKYDKSGVGWGHGDIIYACDAKHGNCTDFHALFVGLCRASGIPARFSIGFPLPEARGEGTIPGYHCWAEFYLEGYGWVPIDASEAWKHPEKREYFFGGHDENRVQFSTGRDLILRPRQHGDPLNYFVYTYAEADGNPVPSVNNSFHYKDLDNDESARAF